MNRKIILIITLVAFFIFGATFVRAFLYMPESEVPAPALEGEAPIREVAEADQPARLIIPSLEIDAHIQYVGVGASGNMAVPNNYTDVGWYRYGPVPGQRGSAVIDGHVDNAVGLAGVFKDLGKIMPGASVFIETNNGSLIEFRVEDVVTYGYKDVPNELLFGRADKSRLNLITCAGSWIGSEETYDERVVVYTTLVR